MATERSRKQADLKSVSDLVHDCGVYSRELSECTSPGASELRRFTGEDASSSACEGWRAAAANCAAWRGADDWDALGQLVHFEKEQRQRRQIALLRNNVWSLRSGPPSEFSAPLPPHLTLNHKGSYLENKANELRMIANKSGN